MRSGSLLEKQAVEVACTLITSVHQTGTPPPEWQDFDSALADRVGIGTSRSHLSSRAQQLAMTVDLVQVQPQLAVKYFQYCVL